MESGVGKTLREARRRRRVDLAEVEAQTKIRSRFLLALENEEWDALPGEAYARGFIRAYAGYLGLDGARLAEEHRRDVAAHRPQERLPVDPSATPARPRRRRRRQLSPRLLAALVSLVLLGIVVAVGLYGGGDSPSAPQRAAPGGEARATAKAPPQAAPRPKPGLSVHLTATAEVWVCLLDAGGEPLVNGLVLPSGAEAGPFRSGSFTISLGNGEVSMTVNGQQAGIPATPSPIGYAIGAGGTMRELSEGERPTCT
ncbi:MAG TPA: helix-turn-helix transcriptional regulator [Solirubrobacterales bacterium]|nr:helix-turn-helix transcriptional regulator [Solirubrobacterales bacterium]